MSFAGTYAAHLEASHRLVADSEQWMGSSPYAGSDLYSLGRSVGSIGTDLALTPVLPFKAATSLSKGLKLAGRVTQAAPQSATRLKTHAVTGRVFKSKNSSILQGKIKQGRNQKVSKLMPNPQAGGPHSSFKYCNQTGRINGYETYDYNPVNDMWSAKARFRGTGKAHGGVNPPVILERYSGKGPGSTPIVPRKPKRWELPHGYE